MSGSDQPTIIDGMRRRCDAAPKVRFASDSPLERTGFELAVPLRWTALRSEVVEEAFGSARYDERGRPQRPAVSACAIP